jgi:hypothetical protein
MAYKKGETYLPNLLHGAESLRTKQVLRYSINFPRFMEPEGSLPDSQEPATCPYPEPTQSSPFPRLEDTS